MCWKQGAQAKSEACPQCCVGQPGTTASVPCDAVQGKQHGRRQLLHASMSTPGSLAAGWSQARRSRCGSASLVALRFVPTAPEDTGSQHGLERLAACSRGLSIALGVCIIITGACLETVPQLWGLYHTAIADLQRHSYFCWIAMPPKKHVYNCIQCVSAVRSSCSQHPRWQAPVV